jgi:hypothetical protein
MAAEIPRYRYRVDRADVLVWVDVLWLAFAHENGAAELTEESVLGHSLWEFVAGDETCGLYREMHARVRSSGKAVVLPFRCDSPTLQRHMRMTISSEEAGQLLYESLLTKVEPQRHLGILDATLPRSNAFLTICSCCKRALLEPIGWLAVEDISLRLGLFERPKVPEMRHTICPECVHILTEGSDNGNAA